MSRVRTPRTISLTMPLVPVSALAALALSGCIGPFARHHTPPVAGKPETPATLPNGQDANRYVADANAAIGQVDKARIARMLAAATQPRTPATRPDEPAVAETQPAQTQPVAAVTRMSVQASEAAPASPAPPQISDLIPLLRERSRQGSNQLTYALILQLLEAAEGGKSATTAPAPAISTADQKLVSDLTAAIQALAMPAVDRGTALADLARKWQTTPDADLKLPALALASRVDSFGVYTPVDAKFQAGKRQTVILYCEVDNFASRKTPEGLHQTTLTQQDTLITEDGLMVWRPTTEEITDLSRNQRRDFYLVKKLTIPDTLAVGKYTLRLTVTDKTTNKIAIVTMPIEVTAGTVTAAK